jgi:hypothetical protein
MPYGAGGSRHEKRRPADPVVIRTSFFLMDQDLALMVHFAER